MNRESIRLFGFKVVEALTSPTTRDLFWRWVTRYAYRKVLTTPEANIPDGVPSIRSKAAPCSTYSPRDRHENDFACEGDGHYLCKECAHQRKVDENESAGYCSRKIW